MIWYVAIGMISFVLSAHGACVPHSSTVGESIWSLLDRALSVSSANKVIYQEDIPYTISSPESYSVGEDLTNTGTADVITITNQGASLDLQGHAIIASAGAHYGINASGGIIHNGMIANFPIGIYVQSNTPNAVGLDFINCSTAIATGANRNIVATACTGRNCGIFNGYISSLPPTAATTVISECNIFDCTGPAFHYIGEAGLIINRCVIDGALSGVVTTTSRYIMITESTFSSIIGDAISLNYRFDATQVRTHIYQCKFISISGNGITLNTLDWSTMQNCSFCNIAHNGLNFVSTNLVQVLGCDFVNINGIGINDLNNATQSRYFNNFFAGVGTPYVGSSTFVQKTPANVRANATDFWQNIVDA